MELRSTPKAARRGGVVARRLWAAGGFVAFCLGAAGVILPVLPTTPFVLLAAFCFARSSERVEAWFRSTALYRRVFETYLTRRTMTVRAKLSILIPVSVLLGVAAFFMRGVTWMLPVFAIVWVGHVIYFGFVVKTEREPGALGEGPAVDARAEAEA